MAILDTIWGIVIGIATNFVVWYFLYHILVPKVVFSPDIRKKSVDKTKENSSGFEYSIKFENNGNRAIIDCEFISQLRIKGMKSKSIWRVVDIPITYSGEVNKRYPIIYPVKKGLHATRPFINLYLNNVDEFSDKKIYPVSITRKMKNKEIILEDLFGLGTKCLLKFIAFGFDEFSGTRKMFLSKEYTIKDIKEGLFDYDLKINERENNSQHKEQIEID